MKRSIVISGHATSIFVEPEFWNALKAIALEKGISIASLVTEIDTLSTQEKSSNLSNRIRVYILKYYRQKAGD